MEAKSPLPFEESVNIPISACAPALDQRISQWCLSLSFASAADSMVVICNAPRGYDFHVETPSIAASSGYAALSELETSHVFFFS